ncbi:hypothetical protein BC830DRAFT_1158511 [Chytriomyces sp. MP71]|nr:hypothetical protein BC830DRAFT_1158511 [Chytriomyces sp. MP71]
MTQGKKNQAMIDQLKSRESLSKSTTSFMQLLARATHLRARSVSPDAVTSPNTLYEGIYTSQDHGVLTIAEAGRTLLFNLVESSEMPEGLSGTLTHMRRRSLLGHVFGVVEIPLLGYRDYVNPVMVFEFLVDKSVCVGLKATFDTENPAVLFTRRV